MKTFFIEMTDTFGGEANYCWVNRFKVTATTVRGAMRKVAKETGFHVRCTGDFGDSSQRWDAVRACICYFVDWFDDDRHADYSNIITL